MVTREAADVLRRAKETLTPPMRWTQKTLCGIAEDGARCFCIDGAVAAAQTNAHPTGAGLCVSLVAKSRGFEAASRFNDAPGRTHAEVLAFLDEAIELAVSLAERAP